MLRIHRLAVFAAVLPVLGACEPDPDQAAAVATQSLAANAPAAAVAPRVVDVTTRDFSFSVPTSIPAGLVTFRNRNEGPDLHHVLLVRLPAGKSVDDLTAAFREHKMLEGAVEVGGPNTPVPGAEFSATVKLEPGSYALICVIPGADGVPHVMKGMSRTITVTPATGPAATEPAADVRMLLTDYAFTTTPALTAGTHTLRIENSATQPHEAFLIQLAPGKTVNDVLAWVQKQQGPPPGKPIGGITDITPGQVNFITHTFEKGEYGLICFVPDAKDGKPHFMHGMTQQFTIE